MSVETFLWQVNFAYVWVFHDFYGLWVKKILLFVVKLMAGLSKLHRTCPWEYFQEKHLFWKNSSNFTNPGHWLKGFWHFLKYFWAASGNCILRAHKNFLMENSFLVTFKFFDLCCIMSQLFLGTLSRLSRQGCENCIRRVQRSYCYGKIYFRLKKTF